MKYEVQLLKANVQLHQYEGDWFTSMIFDTREEAVRHADEREDNGYKARIREA